MRNDKNRILFGEDDSTNNIIKNKKLKKKSNNKEDKEFVNLFLELENRIDLFKDKDVVHILSKTEFVEQERETGRSTLYSFEESFQLLHVNPAHLEF